MIPYIDRTDTGEDAVLELVCGSALRVTRPVASASRARMRQPGSARSLR
jgi:hypothetical protein